MVIGGYCARFPNCVPEERKVRFSELEPTGAPGVRRYLYGYDVYPSSCIVPQTLARRRCAIPNRPLVRMQPSSEQVIMW